MAVTAGCVHLSPVSQSELKHELAPFLRLAAE